MNYSIFILITILVLGACSPSETAFKSNVPVTPVSSSVQTEDLDSSAAADRNDIQKSVIEQAINLAMPFYPQAPEGDWSLPWKEACEEASVILAYYGIRGLPLTRDLFHQEVLSLVEWEKTNLGHYEDTNITETARMLKEYYHYQNFEFLDNPSTEGLKQHLAQGHLIVAPFAGRLLGNPFYSGEGPYYHMLVIKGYDSTHFITNDVGTRRGEDFIFSYDVLMNALHDWHDQGILRGAKKVIVVK